VLPGIQDTHLLLKKQTVSLEIGDIVKRITVGYAQYHNVKNGRTGHLFQNRFNEYLNKKNVLIEPTFAVGFFKDIGQFEMFMKQSNEDKCLESNLPKRYTDEDLEELVSSFVAINNLCTMDIEIRNNVLKNIKEVTGASNRQLSRVLNIGVLIPVIFDGYFR
jgi:hypothetical protein